MAIAGTALFGELSRDPSGWFDLSADWTDMRWLRQAPITGGQYATQWLLGTSGFSGPYLWMGSGDTGGGGYNIGLEYTATGGSPFFDIGPIRLGPQWEHVTVRYLASGPTLDLLVNGVVRDTISGAVLDPLVGSTLETVLNDGGANDLCSIAYARRWQAALTDAQIRAEMQSATPVLVTNLIASSPLPTIANLTDLYGHDWTASGTLTDVADPSLFKTRQVVGTQQDFFEGTEKASGLWGFQQDVIQRIDGREELTVIPASTPGTYRNFTVGLDTDPGGETWTFWFTKDQVATTLLVSLTGTTRLASNLIDELLVEPGDKIGIRGDTGHGTRPHVTWSWEFESDTPNETMYGQVGGIFGFAPFMLTGALADGANAANLEGSICAVNSVLTTTRTSALTAPGVGETYTSTVLLNTVEQNGSGGTPDTRCIMSDAETEAVSYYALPLVPTDIVGMKSVRSAGAPTSANDYAFSVAMTSTTPGQYTTCGAETPTPGTNPEWIWIGNGCAVNNSVEAPITVFVGSSGLELTGLIVYGPGNPFSAVWTYTLRKNEADPPNQPIVSLTGTTSHDIDTDPDHIVAYAFGDLMTLQIVGQGSAAHSNWAFLTQAPNPTGTLIVFKNTIPDTDTTTVFPFLAGGGLDPASFTLTNGSWYQYENVPAGSGYSIQELVPAGWQMTGSSSTGEPLTNLTVTAGEQTSVQVVNRLVFLGQYTIREDMIRRQRTSPHLFNLGKRLFIPELQIDFEAGRGAVVGQGDDPQVMLRLSRDGGHTWGGELWTSAGKIGEYQRRARYLRLGYARDWVVEITVTDPISWSVINCWVTVEEGIN